MKLVITGKSASLLIKVPRIEVREDFEEQLPKVEEALQRVKEVYEWGRENL
ncbi:hypothetical protein KI659_18120 [Litoribacter alkaliphilus]|uniref:Uncharacterized protein n=1 Tax=Litoribacter ruber TaxID=702568 RepID=A0AAP2CJK0_9BACT|nr:hypothetical protein [Litoribacter alkaliphilus]MBS9525943.1 hypothetical protein [Litoribacter alkaliphilus]